ncbi:MAG: DUF427 domain-containing protein [Burkholderiales bacterium]
MPFPSPGHRQFPTHRVEEQPLDTRVTVSLAGQTLADSHDVIRVLEDRNPPRYYIAHADVKAARLEPSETTSHCPFKGDARYFHLKLDDGQLRDVVWTYEQPYDEHRALQGRLAFWEEKIPGLRIEMNDTQQQQRRAEARDPASTGFTGGPRIV